MADACEQRQQGKGGSVDANGFDNQTPVDGIAELSGGAVGLGRWLGIRTATNNGAVTNDSSNAFNAARTWPDLASRAVQYKVTDYLESPQCGAQADGYHYVLRRTFQMVDKRGNDTTLNQIIYFQRSQTRGANGALPLANSNTRVTEWLSKGPGNLGQFGPFGNNPKRARLAYNNQGNFTTASRLSATARVNTFSFYGIDSMSNSNGGRYSQYIDTVSFNLTNGSTCVAPSGANERAELEAVLRDLYVAIDTTALGAQDSLSLFDPEFGIRMNYSVSFTYEAFPACNGGRKFLAITSVFDWCSSSIEKDSIIIKFEDQSAPTFIAKNSTPIAGGTSTSGQPANMLGVTEAERIVISVNVNDCSASLRLPEKNESTGTTSNGTSNRGTDFERDLGTLFNWTVRDGCAGGQTNSNLVRLNYKFQTRKEYNNGYFIDRTSWTERNYTVANMNGGPVALGLPVGEHRIIIEAWDGCSNESTDTLYFNVNDRVAPIMKCDDEINVTLTSNSTSNYFLNTDLGNTGGNTSNRVRTSDQYARVWVNDINEGSRDNCTLDSMFVRRVVTPGCINDYLKWNMDYDLFGNNDGDVTVADFTEIKSGPNAGNYYTPMHMQYVEFYCCDGGANNTISPMVELWGSDVEQPTFGPTGNNIIGGQNSTQVGTNVNQANVTTPSANSNRNWSYCWATVNIEDKTPPQINAPVLNKSYNTGSKNHTMCHDKEIIGDPTVDLPLTDVTTLGTNTYVAGQGKIATSTWANTTFGTPDIYGIECNGTVKYGVIKRLVCDTGIILRHWEVEKVIKSNPRTVVVVRDTQLIWVQGSSRLYYFSSC